jgi:hypothetical protein
MAEFVRVASTNEIAPGEARLVTAKGKEIALFNIDGEFFALDNACTHDDGPTRGCPAQMQGRHYRRMRLRLKLLRTVLGPGEVQIEGLRAWTVYCPAASG